ncbi:hypothetical protein [Athalassotoga saccharophila]|uniref:hypothetical protein n=1 Tax=Athalassotoga saccharophila TaxID=1441386 RepID=UPI0013797867|nr:hypothetical protein [Athalassotoga saccharophila]BBJ28292.1 hypothetical protein ATHSA_1199 [Athalassotoga saccharophila]
MAGRNKVLVPILVIFIIGIFLYLGYVLFFPKGGGNIIRSNQTPQVSVIVNQPVKTDKINPVQLNSNPFLPLAIKLNENSFENLIKSSALSTNLDRGIYVVGMAKGIANMVTLYVSGEILTLNLSDNSVFYFQGKRYLVTYIAPSFSSAVIMDSSTGNLYVVNSQGFILR